MTSAHDHNEPLPRGSEPELASTIRIRDVIAWGISPKQVEFQSWVCQGRKSPRHP